MPYVLFYLFDNGEIFTDHFSSWEIASYSNGNKLVFNIFSNCGVLCIQDHRAGPLSYNSELQLATASGDNEDPENDEVGVSNPSILQDILLSDMILRFVRQ